MNICKNSAKIGFSWFCRTGLKGIGSVAIMGLAQDTVTVMIGAIVFGVTVYEALVEWNEINDKKYTKK